MPSARSYDTTMHSHRFAVWAAGRAASVKGSRFRVEILQKVMAEAEFGLPLVTPDDLPDAGKIDEVHVRWASSLMSKCDAFNVVLTHGQAAKIINVYLKARFCTGPWLLHEKVAALHPPIDRVLLKRLHKVNFGGMGKEWDYLARIGWSKFTCGEYSQAIRMMRAAMAGRPLWIIEEHWSGHQ